MSKTTAPADDAASPGGFALSRRPGLIEAAVAGALLLGFLTLYPFPPFEHGLSDQICQVAYFQILLHPDLAGSIGSAAPKAGVILALGGAHHLGVHVLESEFPIHLLASLLATWFAWIVLRWVREQAGWWAATLAIALCLADSSLWLSFFYFDSNLFFLPPLMSGLWLLSHGRDRSGMALLGVASTMRIEGVAVLAAVALTRAWQRRSASPLILPAIVGAVALAIYVGVAYGVQGSLDRISASASTGFPPHPSLASPDALRSILRMLFDELSFAVMLLPAAYGLAVCRPLRILGCTLAIPALLALNVVSFAGSWEYRFLGFLRPAIIVLGCVGCWSALQRATASPPSPPWKLSSLPALGLALLGVSAALFSESWTSTLELAAAPLVIAVVRLLHRSGASFAPLLGRGAILVSTLFLLVLAGRAVRQLDDAEQFGPDPFVLAAHEFKQTGSVPRGSSAIVEDEVLNLILTRDPGFFSSVLGMQGLQAMDRRERMEALATHDHLWLAVHPHYYWFYFSYLPLEEWKRDPLRLALLRLLRDGGTVQYAGLEFELVLRSRSQLVARIRQPG